MVFFAIKYSRKKNPEATQINDNLKVEIIWIISPVLLVFLMYYYGYKKFYENMINLNI
jgi:heme/copper-type cytochrome/quinol oxidase subunit 2